MIVDSGALELLGYQASALALCTLRLYTTNIPITSATVAGDLTEAAWTGYAPVTVGTLTSPALVGGRAQFQPMTMPVFHNTSLGDQTFYVWGLTNSAGGTLIAAVNIGATLIPVGLSFALNVAISDVEE